MSTGTILSKVPSYWASDFIADLLFQLIFLLALLALPILLRRRRKQDIKPKDGFYKGRIGTTRFRYPADDDKTTNDTER